MQQWLGYKYFTERWKALIKYIYVTISYCSQIFFSSEFFKRLLKISFPLVQMKKMGII